MKILVIEDEKKTAQYLQKGLTEGGHTVEIASDGNEGFQKACQFLYDLIILDIMLPERDGWSIISELRRIGRETLTIILTARGEVDDRVRGLDLGADGYLVKPFAFPELCALIRSLVRRGSTRQPDIFRISDLEVDFCNHQARRSERKLDLTQKEFGLLSLLARNMREVVSRTVMLEKVWDLKFDSATNIVDVHIKRLRSKVDDPFEKKLIQTIRGMGYSLNEEKP